MKLLFGCIGFKMADNVWWSNSKGRIRTDYLLSLTRAYNRIYRVHYYRLIIGKLAILYMPKKARERMSNHEES